MARAQSKFVGKTLWLVAAGIEAVPGIERAKQMGLRVVASDGDPSAAGFVHADDRMVVSTYDIEATVAAAVQYHRVVCPIDGVMCIASDVPLTVASVAAGLGLPGITIESARLATDKLAMKRKLAADGIPVPWFCFIESADHLKSIVYEKGFPLVLKPVDSRGARGVLRLTEEVDLAWAYAKSVGYSPTGGVMVERFLPGPQISTESIVLDGLAYTPGFADRNYEYLERFAPHMIENGGDLPTYLNPETQQAVCQLVEQAAASMGIKNGVVKGDIVVSDNNPYVIEIAARLSGGYFCTHGIPLNTGVDLVGQAILLALGQKINPANLRPRYQRFVSQRYLFPSPGHVERIEGVEEVAKRPGIELCEVRVSVGDVVKPVDSHPRRAGVVIATGESRERAIERAESAVKDILIQTVSLS
jgi:biotin carboxylase